MSKTFESLKLLTPDASRQLFKTNRKFLLDELSNYVGKCVILTHHGTHAICNGVYIGSTLSSAFVTTIPELFSATNLIACINGHTHVSLDKKIGSINLLSNCIGTKYDNPKVVKYNPDAFLKLI